MFNFNHEPSLSSSWGVALDRLAFAVLAAFVFTMPWENAVPMVGGFVVSRWLTLLAGAILALRILVCWRLRKPSAVHGAMLAVVMWSVLSLLWTIDQESTLARAGTFVQLLILVWMIWELVQTEARAVKLLHAYALGAFVLAASTLYNFLTGVQAADLAASRGGTKYHDFRYSVLGVNENDLGLMLALSLPIALYLVSRRKGALSTLFCWAHISLSLIALFLAGSRGGLISAMVGMFMFPLIVSHLPSWQRVAFVAVCAAGVIWGAYLVPDVVWDRLLSTGSEISQGTLTHRTILWAAGLEAFRGHAFEGVGSGAYGSAILKAVDVPLVAHNTFLSILVEQGVIGALLWLALLVCLYYCASRFQDDERWLWKVLLVTWTVGVSALTWEYHKTTWVLFGLLVAHVYSGRSASVFADVSDTEGIAEPGVAYPAISPAIGGIPAPQPGYSALLLW